MLPFTCQNKYKAKEQTSKQKKKKKKEKMFSIKNMPHIQYICQVLEFLSLS